MWKVPCNESVNISRRSFQEQSNGQFVLDCNMTIAICFSIKTRDTKDRSLQEQRFRHSVLCCKEKNSQILHQKPLELGGQQVCEKFGQPNGVD